MTAAGVTESALRAAEAAAADAARPVGARMRALFALRGAGGPRAQAALAAALKADPSALVRHEAAYLLGQLRDPAALPPLRAALEDDAEDAVVRHEAAEAMGAVADPRVLPLLDEYAVDGAAPLEVVETCRIAAAAIRLALAEEEKESGGGDGGGGGGGGAPGARALPASGAVYTSVDPAPPAAAELGEGGVPPSVAALAGTLADARADLFARYRAMFALRDAGGAAAVAALAAALRAGRGAAEGGAGSAGALLRHELAFVLGQMQDARAVPALAEALADKREHDMVRHEAAEALGSVATDEARAILEEYRHDDRQVVRESVAVALDIADYIQDDQALHYAAAPAEVET